MRRKEKEILDRDVIDQIIYGSQTCRLAMALDNHPYVVPLCFGYEKNTLYLHSAREGRKIDILKKNNSVCFEFDTGYQVLESGEACKWGMKYRSVIGFGKASFIDDPKLKKDAFDIIMRQYSDHAYSYSEKNLTNTVIIKIEIKNITGKESGF